MASINMSIRTDSELKAQAEKVLSQLGMNMTGTINMFLQQIVRDQAVPLSRPCMRICCGQKQTVSAEWSIWMWIRYCAI